MAVASREEQLTAAQEAGDVRDLGRVGPAHGPAQVVRTGPYRGTAVAHGRELQHLGHGGVHAGEGVDGEDFFRRLAARRRAKRARRA